MYFPLTSFEMPTQKHTHVQEATFIHHSGNHVVGRVSESSKDLIWYGHYVSAHVMTYYAFHNIRAKINQNTL